MDTKQLNFIRMALYALGLLTVTVFLILVLGNSWLWPDMDSFIADAIGLELSWVLIILCFISLGGIQLLILVYRSLVTYRNGSVFTTGLAGYITPVITVLFSVALSAVIFDEAGSLLYSRAVEDYTLPPLMELSDGTVVGDISTWEEERRDEILTLFNNTIYGPVPEAPDTMEFKILDSSTDALGGKAVRKIVRVSFSSQTDGPFMDILLYLPRESRGPSPLFLGMNFYGNHTTSVEIDIPLPENWVRNKSKYGIRDNRASEESRAVRTSRWPALDLIERGYGLATVYYGDLDPDFDDGFKNGVHPLFKVETGAISAWAWGLSRAMDYLVRDKDVDSDRVALMGHSRLGKAALWAGANDPRFAMVIANESGCLGAALSRRKYGEDIEYITASFPHWFLPGLSDYSGMEENLAVDQHMLLSLIAPRPLYVASAVNDRWSDPEGEFLGLFHSGDAYRLYGLNPGVGQELPEVETPRMGINGYHLRRGVHDVTSYDWEQFLNFADMHL